MKKLTRMIAILLLLPMLASCDFVNQFLEDTTTESGDDAENQPSVQALPFTVPRLNVEVHDGNHRDVHAFIHLVDSYQGLPLKDIPEVSYSDVFDKIFNKKSSYLGQYYYGYDPERGEDMVSNAIFTTIPIYCIEWSNDYHKNCDCTVSTSGWREDPGFPYVVFKYQIEGEIYYRYVVYHNDDKSFWLYDDNSTASQTCYEVYHEIKSSTDVLEAIQVGDTMQELHQVTGVRLYDTTPLIFQGLRGETDPSDETVGKVKGRIDVLLTDGMLRVDYKSEMTYGEFLKWRISLLKGTSQKLDHLTISKTEFLLIWFQRPIPPKQL